MNKSRSDLTAKFFKHNYKLIILVILTAALTAFIWKNSSVSIAESKEISVGIMEFVKSVIDPHNKLDSDLLHVFIRKTAHFTEFFFLGVLYVLICKNSGKIKEKLTFLPPFATLFTAVTDEFIQAFTGRGTQVQDVMLDFAGALCGIVAVSLIVRIRNQKRKEK